MPTKPLEDLLTTKASIDTCRWRAIWKLAIELHQNEFQAAKSIKEAKAICSWVILDAKTACSAVVKKAKTTQGHVIWEAKATCSSAIRDIKARRATQAKALQRQHSNIMQDLEAQVIWEESRSQADFLSTCQAALYTSPPELKSTLAASYHILLQQTPPSPPFVLSQRTSPVEEQPAPAAPPIPVPKQSPRPKRWHPSPESVESMHQGRTTSKVILRESPSSKQWEIPPWNRALKPSHAEAFGRDSDLVKEVRREFFLKHSYNFTMEGTCNLPEIFKQMAMSAKLLGTSIHEIQASWTGPDELKQANYALRSLPKGLKFLWVVPPSESPNIMGLVGIHDPDALWHFSCVTHWPWCGKEGQNKGTVANHLWMVHYRLGLVCNRCHDCQSMMADTLHHHGQQDCCQSGERNLNKSASLE